MRNIWDVKFTVPKPRKLHDGREVLWNDNFQLGVLAETLERALFMIRAAHPDATIYNINHRGKVDLP